MQENDLEHFKRFEKFIEQESLSDQRFRVNDRYDLTIPDNYLITNSVERYTRFFERWNPEERGRVHIDVDNTGNFIKASRSYESFSESDFNISEQLLAGKTYEVTAYGTRTKVTYADCLNFLNTEGAGLYGLHAIYTLLDLNEDKVTLGRGIVSIDLNNLKDKNAIFFAERSGSLLEVCSSHKGYLTEGNTLLTLKEKASK